MSCVINSGYSLQCRDNLGGIQKVFIGEYTGDDLQYSFSIDNIISTFSAVGVTPSFYEFDQEIEVGSYQEAGQFSTENGTSFYEQTLEITLQRLDAVVRNQVKILGQGIWRILVLDQNGRYWLMGAVNGCRVSSATPGVGKAYGDLNGAVINFISKEKVPAYVVTEAAALTLIV